MEGLTAQTLESQGGLLFTTKQMLREKVIRLACHEEVRLELGENLKRYLEEVVSWEVVAGQYLQVYELARESKRSGQPVMLDSEF
jgi:glycosyltransferase involved in cell wall biosynthesis